MNIFLLQCSYDALFYDVAFCVLAYKLSVRWVIFDCIFNLNFLSVVFLTICLQCFDAVGWAAGRASGL